MGNDRSIGTRTRMKNPAQERFLRRMRQYHRNHPWRLEGGLFVPHAYLGPRKTLSWWDDLGFILNGRRVMVWWVHPRMQYADRIHSLAWQEAGESPLNGEDIFGSAEKQFAKLGRSRKKIISYRTAEPPAAMKDYYARYDEIEKRIEAEGLDFVVTPSMKIQRLSWCTGVELCLPLEVRDREELEKLAALARRLLKRETTSNDEFPAYQYRRQDWLAELVARDRDRASRNE